MSLQLAQAGRETHEWWRYTGWYAEETRTTPGSSLLTSVDKETGNRGREGGLRHFEQVKSEGLTGSPVRRGLVLREKIWAGKFNQSTYTYPVKVSVTQSCPTLATPWTVALQAPLAMGFSRQEYWSGLLFPSPGGSSRLRDRTWVSHVAGMFFTIWATGKTSYPMSMKK